MKLVNASELAKLSDKFKKVLARAVRKGWMLSPVENIWDSFFLSTYTVSDDFMTERASQKQQERETF